MNFYSVKTGDVLRFKYNGGENPGQERIVYVTRGGSTTFAGYCFTRFEVRNFSVDKMESPVNIKGSLGVCHIIELKYLPSALSNGVVMANDYKKDGWEAFVDEVNGVLVVVFPKPSPSPIQVSHTGISFSCKSSDGKRSCNVYADGNRYLYAYDAVENVWKYKMTPSDLATILTNLEKN